jgi:putative methyltransferase
LKKYSIAPLLNNHIYCLSGIVSRENHSFDQSPDEERLDRLASFQVSILSHVLTLPALQYAVYSTCSIHAQENEQVVQKILEKHKNQFELCEILPDFPHRGVSGYGDNGKKCVRLSSREDATNGFFVACFRRNLYDAGDCNNKNMDKVKTDNFDIKNNTEIAGNVKLNRLGKKRKYVNNGEGEGISGKDKFPKANEKTKKKRKKNKKHKSIVS